MSRHRKSASVLCVFTLAALAVACSNDGVKNEASEAGEAVSDAARTGADATTDAARRASDGVTGAIENAGRAGDAAMETFDVKAALVADSRIEADDINVDTDHTTKTVVLKGSVPSDDQRTLAGQIAMQQADGYRVDNQLTVKRG